jgi:hypothetical protein
MAPGRPQTTRAGESLQVGLGGDLGVCAGMVRSKCQCEAGGELQLGPIALALIHGVADGGIKIQAV